MDARAKAGAIAAYIGFTHRRHRCTYGSLTGECCCIGCNRQAIRPIALMGGGATRVGDPSGKDKAAAYRAMMRSTKNLKGIRAVFSKFLKFEGDGGNAIMAGATRCPGSTSSTTSISCATSAGISPSTECFRWRFGEVAPRSSAGTLVPRIQLHGVRRPMIRRAQQAPRNASCRWAVPINGATSSTVSISAAACAMHNCLRSQHR